MFRGLHAERIEVLVERNFEGTVEKCGGFWGAASAAVGSAGLISNLYCNIDKINLCHCIIEILGADTPDIVLALQQ